jgi:hypothetical protein
VRDHNEDRIRAKLTRERLALNQLREQTKTQAAVVKALEAQLAAKKK